MYIGRLNRVGTMPRLFSRHLSRPLYFPSIYSQLFIRRLSTYTTPRLKVGDQTCLGLNHCQITARFPIGTVACLQKRYHGSHGHSHGGHGHSHGSGDEDDGQDSIAVRFARGESFGSIFLSRLTKASGIRIGAVSTACVVSWFDLFSMAGYTGLMMEPVGAIATIAGGWPVLKHGYADLQARRVTLSLSMSIGILAALCTGETFTSALMTLVVLLSEQLEELTVQKAQANISTMLESLPATVELVNVDGSLSTEELEHLKVGDIVRIRPGGHLPVDGVVASGLAYINEAQMTGESMPEKKQIGDRVFAGSITQSGTLDVRAEAVGDHTVYGQILTSVREAQTLRTPMEALADKVAKYVVYFAFASSAFTLGITGELPNAVSVLVVAGACGVCCTPLVIVGGMGKAARKGCVIKSGVHLEMLADMDTVVFDKTGTLTTGTPQVADVFIVPSSVISHDSFVRLLYAAESRSEHPIAAAVVSYAEEQLAKLEGLKDANSLIVTDYFAEPGRGVYCRVDGDEVIVGNRELMRERGVSDSSLQAVPGNWEHSVHALHASEVLVARNRQVLGGLLVRDTIRPEAAETIASLKRLGINTIIVSGDRLSAVQEVAKELNINEAYGCQSPIQKAEFIQSLRDKGNRVVMVGDGINDASSMGKANVGIAMGSASTLTQRAADIVLLHDTLERIPEAIKISKQARAIIYQNIFGTLTVDLIGSVAAFKGMLPPALAASFHGVWDVVFILNSARLLVPTTRFSANHGHQH